VDSARGFVRLWFLLALLILGYAWVDLRLNPRLYFETEISMRPDLSQLPDLMHWGGRLLNHGAVSLLLGNALVLAGLAALLGRGIAHFVRKLLHPSLTPPVSIVPAAAPTSVPPPHKPV
jgi:hypothetical protein